MDALQAAISKAKWKEIVTLTAVVNSGDDDKEEGDQLHQEPQEQVITLTSALDEEHGGVQWNPIVAPGNTDSRGAPAASQSIILSQYLQTKPWILPMLNDTKRNELYFKAIERAVTKLNNTTTNSSATADNAGSSSASWNVLDLGCGTGLLGMIAAKQILSSQQQQQEEQSDKDDTATDGSLHVAMVDMSSEMVEIARQTVADNSLDSVVKVNCGHSCEIPPLFLTQNGQEEDPKQRSLVPNEEKSKDNATTNAASDEHQENSVINTLVVSELLESGLLGEGWLPAVRDAFKRHVHPQSSSAVPSNVIAIPQGATVHVAAVEGDWIRNYAGPCDTVFLQAEQSEETSGENNTDGPSSLTLRAARGTYLTLHADKLLRDGRLRLLSDPMAVLDFDAMNSMEQKQRQCRIQVPITRSGRVDGILVWWTLTLYNDPDDTCSQPLVYSMAPNSMVPEVEQRQPWQDHWHQCLHLVEKSSVVEAGSVQPLDVMHDDSRIYVKLGSSESPKASASTATTAEDEPPTAKRRCLPSNESGPTSTTMEDVISQTSLISPSRAYQLNDGYRVSLLRRAIARAVANSSMFNGKPLSSMTVLDLSDSSLCAILAAQAGARNVYSLESGTSSHGGNDVFEICRIMAQLAKCTMEIKILPCHAEQLTMDLFQDSDNNDRDTSNGKAQCAVDLCVAEPYYQVMEDWPLVQALNLYYMVRSLRKRRILTDRTIMLPGTVRLVGCAIESRQLHSAYRPCGDDSDSSMIHGIEHRVINQILARPRSSERDDSKNATSSQYQYDLSLPMWQYDYTRLTPPVELARLSYNEPSFEPSIQTTSRVSFYNKTGVCHAMMVWLEYDYNSTATMTTVDIPEGNCNQGDQAEEDRLFLSTDNQSYRQLVQMIPEPVAIHEKSDLELVCTCTIGGLQQQTHRLEIRIESRRSDQTG